MADMKLNAQISLYIHIQFKVSVHMCTVYCFNAIARTSVAQTHLETYKPPAITAL